MAIPCFAVYADLKLPAPEIELKSYGNIIYEDENGTVQLYADDIALLKEKISSIPEDIFDAGIYSHVHEWKYINVNEETHTRTCEKCGSQHDITNTHKPVKSEECSLEYHSKIYDGYMNTCKCGYTWETEKTHTNTYSIVDETKHRVTCALSGTKYCAGMEAYDEGHTLSFVPKDNNTHAIRCELCSYEKTENCSYAKEVQDENTGVKKLLCECGNYVVVTEDPEPDPDPDQNPASDNGEDRGVSSNNLIISDERED